MWKGWTGLFLLVLVVLTGTDQAAADKRVALVIGNSAYEHATPLANPKNDASRLAAILRQLQFEVIEGVDLDRAAFEGVVRKFARAIRGADVALLFYAGHGLQVDGRNYLAPTDADLSDEADLDFETLPLRTILKQMERETRTNLVFLDACRDNPLARNLARSLGTRSVAVGRGLARIETGVGTLIAFATEPGNVALDGTGTNSPFTQALLKHIKTPGLDVDLMLRRVRKEVLEITGGRQVPWSNSSLTGRFEFASVQTVVDAKPNQATASPVSPAPSATDRVVELAYWESISSSKSADEFKTYLRRFPDGEFAELARLRIQRLQQQAALSENKAAKKVEATTGHPPINARKLTLTARVRKDEKTGKNRFGITIMAVPDILAPCFAFAGKRGLLVSSTAPGGVASAVGVRKGDIILSWDGQETHTLTQLVTSVAATDTDAKVPVAIWRVETGEISFDQDLIRCARREGSVALRQLATWFENGTVVGKDDKQASDLKREAPVTDPELSAGEMNRRGYAANERKDYEEAVRWYRRAAESGDPHAMGSLARKYYTGYGVPKDDREAFKWFRKSAEQDILDSVASLGWLYYKGFGVQRDYAEALKWTRKAAARDHPYALANMGLHYENGDGVGRDYHEALKWYRKSADRGHSRAMDYIGDLYASGKGIAKDKKKAAEWYEKAVANGNKRAMISLGILYSNGDGVRKDYGRAIALYKKAEGYDSVVWYNLGLMYAVGQGVAKNPKHAAELVTKALEAGNDWAVKQLADNSNTWGRPFRVELQKILRQKGFYNGAIDGSFGRGTIAAIRDVAGK